MLGQPSEESLAEIRGDLTRWQQARGEVSECGNPEALARQICEWMPNADPHGSAGDIIFFLTEWMIAAPHVTINAGLDWLGVPSLLRIPDALDVMGFSTDNPLCRAVIENLPAIIEFLSEEEVKEATGIEKAELQEILCTTYSTLSSMSTDPSHTYCVPGSVGSWTTPEGSTATSEGGPIPQGSIFAGCILGLGAKAELDREIQTILAQSREEYRVEFDEIRAQQALGLLAPAEAETARLRAASEARARALRRIEEARGIYTFDPLDVGDLEIPSPIPEGEVKAAAAGGAAGLVIGALLVWAMTRKK